MSHKVILPLAAVGLLLFAAGHAWYVQRPEPDPPPVVPPATSPFGHTVAGVGIVEPNTEASGTGTIAVGSQVGGVVSDLRARIGQDVKAGEVLFELDKRQAEAELEVREAALALAESQHRKLERQPRPEEVPPSEAQVRVAEANLKQMEDLRNRGRRLVGGGALAEEDMVIREQNCQAAQSQLALARANLALLKAGAWDADKAISYASVQQARAQVNQARTQLELLRIHAPVDGTILQINLRPSEYVAAAPGQSLIVIGNVQPLHVRVSIDEEDWPRLLLNGPGIGKVRGDPTQEPIPLRFLRIEPLIVPKTSLTGNNVERVDTRVVQLVYAVEPETRLVRDKKLLVGQLLDVFLDTRPPLTRR